MPQQFDVAIVGGGSAGCVLANRISADPNLRVALIEAGPDTPPDHQDEVIWDSYPIIAYFDPRHHWTDLRAYTQPAPKVPPDQRKLQRYEQAKIMGGGSSINGTFANRGAPWDYDDWHAAGAIGWGWQDVLPYFRKLERDLDFDGPVHGCDGPLPIRRIAREEWGGFSRAAGAALANEGFSWIADQNAGFEPGYYSMAINNENDRRVSTATAYLTDSVRSRPNLTILANTTARRVQFTGGKATGVDIEQEGERSAIVAREIILALGAIHTPALLLKSGVGPGADLRSRGVDVNHDSPGVGRNLQEHPQIAASSWLEPFARIPWSQRRHIFTGFRWSSKVDGCAPVDMAGVVVNRGAWHPLGCKMGGFLIWVNKSYSTGVVSLNDGELATEPRVELNFLSDERDLIRLREGLKLLDRLYLHPAMRSASRDPFPTGYTEASRDLAVVNRANWARTAPLAALLERPSRLRSRAYRTRVSGGLSLHELVEEDAALDQFLLQRTQGTWHCCGTAKMGDGADPKAVCDPHGNVFGVRGLRVGDASLMPSVPSANTNLPTIMIAEKIADAVLAYHQGKN